MACIYPAFVPDANRCGHQMNDIANCNVPNRGAMGENDPNLKTCYQRYILEPHLAYCETKTCFFKTVTIALSIIAALSVIAAGLTLAAVLGAPFIAGLVAGTFISIFITKVLVVSIVLSAFTVPSAILFGLGLCAANREKEEVLALINNQNP